CVNEVDHFLNAAYLKDRQDRTKDFILHRRRVRRHVHQHGRLDKTFTSIIPPPVEDRSTVEQPRQPIEMTIADDAAVIRALLRIFSIEFNQGLLQILEKLRGHVLKYENVVRRGARL